MTIDKDTPFQFLHFLCRLRCTKMNVHCFSINACLILFMFSRKNNLHSFIPKNLKVQENNMNHELCRQWLNSMQVKKALKNDYPSLTFCLIQLCRFLAMRGQSSTCTDEYLKKRRVSSSWVCMIPSCIYRV